MFLVLFGHFIDPKPAYFLFTSPLRMLLFFAISGYLLKADKTVGQFLKNLVRSLIIPWLILGFFRLILLIPSRGVAYIPEGLIRLITGVDLWFMPCFIIAVTLFFLLRKYLKKFLWIALASFAAFGMGVLLNRSGFLPNLAPNQALTVLPYFVIGYLFKTFEDFFRKLSWWYVGLAALVYTGVHLLATRIFPSTWIDMSRVDYYNIPFCLFLSYLGVLCLFTATSKADFKSWVLSFIGQNTLVIYIWSGGAVAILVALAARLGWNIPVNDWTALMKAVYACIVCGLCSVILERFVPWVVGKKKTTAGR